MMMFLIHELLAGALFYTIFCRATKTCRESTRTDVLLALWLMGCASVAMMAAPIVTQWQPDWIVIMLMGSVVTLQWVTSRYWREGVPPHFRKPTHEDCCRLAQDSCAVSGEADHGGKVEHRIRG